jgi:hypothetical protein
MRASLSVFASSATTRTPWIMLCSAGADERLTPWNVFNRMPKAWSMMATASASLELKWWYRAFWSSSAFDDVAEAGAAATTIVDQFDRGVDDLASSHLRAAVPRHGRPFGPFDTRATGETPD